jgi:hypothetical protein
MALPLTTEFQAILKERIISIEENKPMLSMDTIKFDGKEIVIIPHADGMYNVEIWINGAKKRTVAVASAIDAPDSQCFHPLKFLKEMRA